MKDYQAVKGECKNSIRNTIYIQDLMFDKDKNKEPQHITIFFLFMTGLKPHVEKRIT